MRHSMNGDLMNESFNGATYFGAVSKAAAADYISRKSLTCMPYEDGGPAPAPIPGDYNRDGCVDTADYILMRAGYGTSVSEPGSGADGNGDGAIDTADYVIWRANIGRGC
jgi:hypothetical protein